MKPVTHTVECLWCGDAFQTVPGPGRPRKYCCRAHRQRAYESRLQMGIGTVAQRNQILEDAGGICYICFDPITDEWEFDHVIPTTLGGPTVRWNLKPVHGLCNREKAAKLRYVVQPLQNIDK